MRPFGSFSFFKIHEYFSSICHGDKELQSLLPNNAANTRNLTSNSSFIDWLKQNIKDNDQLTGQVFLTFLRDFVWAWWAYENLNYRVNEIHDPHHNTNGEWLGQQLWGTVALLFGMLFLYIIYKITDKKTSITDTGLFLFAAAIAIFSYDKGQQIGISLGQDKLSLSPVKASYFSGLFAGMLESETQNAVITLGNILKNPTTRKEYLKNPIKLLKEIGLSGTIGATGGAIWQIVYTACVSAKLGAPLSALLVSTTVAACNITSNKINTAIIGIGQEIETPKPSPC